MKICLLLAETITSFLATAYILLYGFSVPNLPGSRDGEHLLWLFPVLFCFSYILLMLGFLLLLLLQPMPQGHS